ncbi:hypothetical protein ACFVIM_33640 [Streptomyces sp. NPDC057638]|uniref:hypothetical protein n=1 Tax=Streptomyces sp. NPDC057638 TaxID=3346190 RepID=UPI0036B6A818
MEHPVRIVEGRVILPAGIWGVLPDLHREIRGYDFYPSFEDLARIPPLGATADVPDPARTLHIHYATPREQYDWFVAELDPISGRAFGWQRAGGPYGEWGHFILGDLESVVFPASRRARDGSQQGPQLVERDTDFRPTPAALCLPASTL